MLGILSRLKYVAAVTFLIMTGCKEETAVLPETVETKTRRDITLTQEIATDTAIQTVRFYMKGDVGMTKPEDSNFTTLHYPEKGIYLIDHKSRTFQLIPVPEIPERKPNGEASQQELKQYSLIERSAKMAYTGRERKIGKWNCQEFIIWDSYGSELPEYLQSSLVAWIAEDFKNGEEIQNRKFAISPDGMMSRSQAIIGKKFELPGFAIQMVTRQADSLPMINTFKGISYEPLDSEDFKIPADYTLIED